MTRRSSNSTDVIDEGDSPVEGLADGTLAIQGNNLPTSDIWHRPSYRDQANNHQHNKSKSTLIFEIPYARVMPQLNTAGTAPTTTTRGTGSFEQLSTAKKYVIYDISVRQPLNDQYPVSIERRYTHFLHLINGLRKDHPTLLKSIVFPKKVLIGNFTSNLIAERSAAFELILDFIMESQILRESSYFLNFLQSVELNRACQLLDERQNEQAVPILENCFRLLNKIYLDRSKSVLLVLCRLVAACTTSPVAHPSAERWCELALHRFDSVSDADLLVLYIPLLHTCNQLWRTRGRNNNLFIQRLHNLKLQGIKTEGVNTLTQAINTLDARNELI